MSDRLLMNDRLRFVGRQCYLVRGVTIPESETIFPVADGTVFINPSIPPQGMTFETGVIDRRVISTINYKWYNAVININNPMDRVNRNLRNLNSSTPITKSIHCNSINEVYRFSSVLYKNGINHSVDNQYIHLDSYTDLEYANTLLTTLRKHSSEDVTNNTDTTEYNYGTYNQTQLTKLYDDFEF